MAKKQSETPSGDGLELDRIELPSLASPGKQSESMPDPEREPAAHRGTGSSAKRGFRPLLIALTATLAMLEITAVYLWRQELKVSSLSFEGAPVSGSYLRVGPISTTIQNNEVIRLTLDIGCKNDTTKEKLAEKDSRIRDIVVSVITAPDTAPLLEKHQYDAVRAKIKERLGKLGSEPIGEVYFSELLTY